MGSLLEGRLLVNTLESTQTDANVTARNTWVLQNKNPQKELKFLCKCSDSTLSSSCIAVN